MKTLSMTPCSDPEKKPAAFTGQQAADIIRPYISKEASKQRYAVRDILRNGFDSYLEKHSVPYHSQKIIRALMACGTGELGYTLSVCENCGRMQMTADKCGSRYCCSCSFVRQLQWQRTRKAEIIDGIPYYHVIFTVPHELNSIIFQNPKELLTNLFHSVKDTVLGLSSERSGLIPGIQMVLHTFSSSMLLHYHIHMLVSGGGLSSDGKSFKKMKSQNFFLPVRVMCARYRSLFMQGLKDIHDAGLLQYNGDNEKFRNSFEWKDLLDTCYGKEWNIEIKKYLSSSDSQTEAPAAGSFSRYALHPPVADEAVHAVRMNDDTDDPDVDTAVEYLSQYSKRSAITDNRIRSWDDAGVSFEYKDYRSGGAKKVMTLTVDEFIRRFLLHILPAGFQKIRYGGFLAGCVRAKNLALIRKLLEQEPPDDPTQEMTAVELCRYFYNTDYTICPCCGSRLLKAGRRMNLRFAAQTVIAFSTGSS